MTNNPNKHNEKHNDYEWEKVAPYYDLYFGDKKDDLKFWKKIVHNYESPILELASGTGRLSIPIAKMGKQITGIDISSSMIKIAKQKILNLSPKHQKNIQFKKANIMDFKLRKKFNLIFMWGFLAVNEQEQKSLLKSIKNHLKPEGEFIFDIYNFPEPTHSWSKFDVEDPKKIKKQNFSIVRQSFTKVDANSKLKKIIYFWDIISDAKKEFKRIVVERTEKIYSLARIKKTLKKNGFIIKKIYGNYDFSPWKKNSPRIILVTKLKKNTNFI